MHAFACPRCAQLVFFHNTACLRCGTALGFDPTTRRMVEVTDPQLRCVNAEVAACNWVTDAPASRCRSCVLTRTRPGDHDPQGLDWFAQAEGHKRRVVFQLLELGLPVEPLDPSTGTGMAFDLLSSRNQPVTTGHADGLITLDLAEVDDAHRTSMRQQLDEPYRTVLGHLRHEVGHQQFVGLVTGADLERARALFGDERADYQVALDRHYRDGAPDGWEATHVSAYATMHPAEDWAESFAHLLHIVGVLQTAGAYRVVVEGPDLPGLPDPAGGTGPHHADPATVDLWDVDALVDAWLPLSYALNAINRSIGGEDLYPFVLPGPVLDKLRFVHAMVRQAASGQTAAASAAGSVNQNVEPSPGTESTPTSPPIERT